MSNNFINTVFSDSSLSLCFKAWIYFTHKILSNERWRRFLIVEDEYPFHHLYDDFKKDFPSLSKTFLNKDLKQFWGWMVKFDQLCFLDNDVFDIVFDRRVGRLIVLSKTPNPLSDEGYDKLLGLVEYIPKELNLKLNDSKNYLRFCEVNGHNAVIYGPLSLVATGDGPHITEYSDGKTLWPLFTTTLKHYQAFNEHLPTVQDSNNTVVMKYKWGSFGEIHKVKMNPIEAAAKIVCRGKQIFVKRGDCHTSSQHGQLSTTDKNRFVDH